jgi:hypothetical protein
MRASFLDMSFFAKDILEILGSQIEIKWVFSLVRVLTTLKHCHLEMENIDQIIIVMKNWFDELYLNCKLKLNLKQNLKAKKCLTKKTIT